MSSHYGLISYVLTSEVRYYLKLKEKEIACLKSKKEKTAYLKIIKMFIHIEYSLQIEIHRYDNGV